MSKQVPDAGTGMSGRQRYGVPGEIYRCPEHTGQNCDMCGGNGFRSVCNKTTCHDHGCAFGTCVATRVEFDAQELRKSCAGGGCNG